MTAIAERISQELLDLPEEEQDCVLAQIQEYLHDLRAKKIYDAVKSGEMATYKSASVIADLRSKHGI